MIKKTITLKKYGRINLLDLALHIVPEVLGDTDYCLNDYQRGYLQGRYDQAVKTQEQISISHSIKNLDEKDYKIIGLESELKIVIDVLLKVSPEHTEWVKINFPNVTRE